MLLPLPVLPTEAGSARPPGCVTAGTASGQVRGRSRGGSCPRRRAAALEAAGTERLLQGLQPVSRVEFPLRVPDRQQPQDSHMPLERGFEGGRSTDARWACLAGAGSSLHRDVAGSGD